MRKLILTGVLGMFMVSFVSAQNGTASLPQAAQDFINENFADETVTKVDEDSGWLSWDDTEMYEVHFANGLRLDFNEQGEVTEISGGAGIEIPEDAVPNELSSYVEENYPGEAVVSWEIENDKQEVELSNGMELEFDLSGKFVKED